LQGFFIADPRIGGYGTTCRAWCRPTHTGMKFTILAILVGLAAGLLGALCGVGGGIVMVPAFIALLGLEHKQAVATSMAVIIITAIAATLNNSRANNLIDWKVVAAVGAASAVAAWFGSDLMRSLGNQTLTRIFGLLLVVFGARMLWKAGI
jgi:uncharacterized membrane protein YfcA